MTPTHNALGLCEAEYRPIATYYSSCNGTNPLLDPVQSALVSLEMVDLAVTELVRPGGSCAANPFLLDCSEMVDYAHGNLTLLFESAVCPPVQDDWNEFFHQAVCREGYEGLFDAWLAEYVTVFVLYFTLLVGCLSYQYIGTHWRLGMHLLLRFLFITVDRL
jgi:hypothetical protein